MSTPFAVGRRWFCETPGRARFWFVILGPGLNFVNNPAPNFKRCRIEVHPDDMNRAGGKDHGREGTYSHKHLKKYAKLEPEGTP